VTGSATRSFSRETWGPRSQGISATGYVSPETRCVASGVDSRGQLRYCGYQHWVSAASVGPWDSLSIDLLFRWLLVATTFVVIRHGRRSLLCRQPGIDSRVSATILQPVCSSMYQQSYVPLFDARVGYLAFSSGPFAAGGPVGEIMGVVDSLLE
jgi:hypothetical protein